MFIELKNPTRLVKLEKIDKISLLKSEIEFSYEHEKENIYITQRFSTEARAKEVYEDLKKFINWKNFLIFHNTERGVDFRETISLIKEKTGINFALGFSDTEAIINTNAIFTIPEE